MASRALELHRANLTDEAAILYDQVLVDRPEHAQTLGLRAAVDIGRARRAAAAAATTTTNGDGTTDAVVAQARKDQADKDKAALLASAEDLLLRAWTSTVFLPTRPVPPSSNDANSRQQAAAAGTGGGGSTGAAHAATVHNNLGEVLRMQGRPRDASLHFLEAARLDPAMASPVFNLGLTILGSSGDAAAAAAHFQQALAREPGHKGARARLQQHGARVGRVVSALFFRWGGRSIDSCRIPTLSIADVACFRAHRALKYAIRIYVFFLFLGVTPHLYKIAHLSIHLVYGCC